jgi:hypothetical protein
MKLSKVSLSSAVIALSYCFSAQISNAQSYAALAKAFADAPLVAHIKVSRTQLITPDPAPNVARFYAEGAVVALIRAPGPQAPAVKILADLPRDSRGKPPRVKQADWLIAARTDAGQIQLTATPLVWTANLEEEVRDIVTAAAAPGAPGPVRRVTGAFYSPGNIPGESETQIFFDATRGKGSLSVLHRPGAAPAWSASFGEMASDGPPPAKGTLGWYRLVCGLPKALPDAATAELDDTGKTAAAADYAFVLRQLGSCDA